MPKRNAGFWREKFESNRLRDARKIEELCASGYRVIIVWQCETDNPVAIRKRLSDLRKTRRVDCL